MIIKDNSKQININTLSNWPLIADLFIKWGHQDITPESTIEVADVDKIISELSAWGIPWRQSNAA